MPISRIHGLEKETLIPRWQRSTLEGLGREMDKERTSRGDYKAHKVDIQNTTPSPVLRRGRSARMRPNLDI